MDKEHVKNLITYCKSNNKKYWLENMIDTEFNSEMKRVAKTDSFLYANHVFGFEYKKNLNAWFRINIYKGKMYFDFTHTYNVNTGAISKRKDGLNTFLYNNFKCFA